MDAFELCPTWGTWIPTERATDEDRRLSTMTVCELVVAMEAAADRTFRAKAAEIMAHDERFAASFSTGRAA